MRTPFLEILILEPSQKGNVGALLIDGRVFCWTMARDYTDKGYAIPTGLFPYEAYNSPTYGPTFQIIVEGHDFLLFHILNTENQSTGCIGLGDTPGYLEEDRAVLESGIAFKRFMKVMKDVKKGMIRISRVY